MRAGILFIGLQPKYLSQLPKQNRKTIKEAAEKLANWAQIKEVPIVYIEQRGTERTPKEFGRKEDNSQVIYPIEEDAFSRTDLYDLLVQKGVEDLIISGIYTRRILPTSKLASALNFYPVTASDLITDTSPRALEDAMRYFISWGRLFKSTESLTEKLQGAELKTAG